MVPQELSASRRCRKQSMLISSLGIFHSLPRLSRFSFSGVTQPTKALLISAKPAACGTLASDHFPAMRWLCRHVPESTVPSGHRSSQGTHSPVTVMCWRIIFTQLHDKAIQY